MKIGRSHKWYYDQGVWKETKMTPDEWEFSYAVTKRRAGKAPKGSGVPVGTEYHWYILGHQNVCKLDANSYMTAFTGIKFKLAHKRADADKWNISDKAQRKRLIRLLGEMIEQLQEDEITLVKSGDEEAKNKTTPKKVKSNSVKTTKRSSPRSPSKKKAA
jgi:hypothetical protein